MPRPSLPEFNLDFGYVVYGLVVSKLVLLTNIGHCPVSFTTAHTALERTGFSVDLGDRIRSLPGDPDYESIEFTVRFDPAAIRCPEGQVQALLPFNVSSTLGIQTYSCCTHGMIQNKAQLCTHSTKCFDLELMKA